MKGMAECIFDTTTHTHASCPVYLKWGETTCTCIVIRLHDYCSTRTAVLS